MIRLACCVLFTAAFVQAYDSWNFNLDWSQETSDEDHHWIGHCAWSWLKTLTLQGYQCDSDPSGPYPRVAIAQKYLNKPTSDPVLAGVLQQVKCTLWPSVYKMTSKTVVCGNGWVKKEKYCICFGSANCTNPTTTTKATTTTTKAATTSAPTTTTTTSATTTQLSGGLPSTTPVVQDFAPTVTGASVAAGSVLSLQGRQPSTVSFTIAAKPAPTSVTLSGVSLTAILSGVALSSPANSYLYTYTFGAVDYSDNGLWTVTVNNGVGSPATYQFSISLPVFDVTVSGNGDNAVQAIQPSGLVAFQTFTCNQIVLGLVPDASSFTQDNYASSAYAQLFFDAFQPYFNLFNSGNDNAYTLPNSDCPVNGVLSNTPFWMMVYVNPTSLSPGSYVYDVTVWTSPDNVYSPWSSTPASGLTFSTGSLSYAISQIVFDTNGGLNQRFINYPNAV